MTPVFAADTEALWYLTRGTGLVSLVLLTVVVVLGVLQAQDWSSRSWPKLMVAGMHRNASLVMVVFLAIHIVSTVVDGFAPISWLDAVVPLGSPYRPVWLGLGALAFDLLLAVVVTSLLRRRLPHRLWRTVHWAAYACWPIALVHGLGTGSDGTTVWVLALDAVCLAAVVGAVAWRIGRATALSSGGRAAASVATGAVVIVIAMWTLAGPASAGWARRAGTPDDLLADAPAAGAGGATSSPAGPAALTPPFQSDLDASSSQAPTSGGTQLVVDGRLTDVGGHLHLELVGPATARGGLQLRSGRLTLGPDGSPDEWSGPVTGLQGGTVTATVRDGGGRTVTVTVQLQLDTSGHVSGSVTASPPRTGG